MWSAELRIYEGGGGRMTSDRVDSGSPGVVLGPAVTSQPSSTARRLAGWAASLAPTEADDALAARSLKDTLAVAVAARWHPYAPLALRLGEAGRLATLAHLLDYDDLHVPSTSHISAVCVATAVAMGGGAAAYLGGAGVMARLGTMLGWRHYDAGWHVTCTAGAPGAAVTSALALGLDEVGVETAISLAVPAAGGVSAVFGTSGKALQVGFAADAGVRAARLAADGATADRAALDQWLGLVGGTSGQWDRVPAIPGGLAVKAYPCCYALQRPITAVCRALGGVELGVSRVASVTVRVPADTLRPLIHAVPSTGLEGKFSLPYGVAAAILDGEPGLSSFTDAAVGRDAAQALLGRVRVETTPGGGGLLAGCVEVEVRSVDGRRYAARVERPPGAPGEPMADATLARKLVDCAGEEDAAAIVSGGWQGARTLCQGLFPA